MADNARFSRPARVFLLLALATWAQIAFGALVRAKQAGLSCPDWPLCHGALVPNLRLTGVVYEYGHRVFVNVLLALYLVGATLVWRDPLVRLEFRKPVIGLGILLGVQALFGGLTVLLVNREAAPRPETWPVVSHLILGNAFAALALVTGLALRERAQPEPGPPVAVSARDRVLGRLWTASLLAQMVLGGLIAGSLQGLACAEFPTCNGGEWLPPLQGYVAIQFFHRCNAYVLVTLGWSLAWRLRGGGRLGQVSSALGWLILAQVGLGAMNIWSQLKPHVTTAHSLVAALLFSTTAVFAWELARRPIGAAAAPGGGRD